MLDSLKQAGKHIEREIGHAWESLADEWHELLSRSSHALRHFEHLGHKDNKHKGPPDFPQWSLLAGEIEETDDEVVVRVELPGMQKSDCQVSIEDNLLKINGKNGWSASPAIAAIT